MRKYMPLRDHLRMQTAHELSLTFEEIERIIGASLPRSAGRSQWWANTRYDDDGHVQREAWRAAGYDAFHQAGSDRVIFRKVSHRTNTG